MNGEGQLAAGAAGLLRHAAEPEDEGAVREGGHHRRAAQVGRLKGDPDVLDVVSRRAERFVSLENLN